MSGKGHFAQHRLIDTTEGTIDGTSAAALEAHSFTIKPADFTGSAMPKVSAWKSGGLGAITITIWEKVGNNWNQVFKDASAAELSATNPQEAITSYGTYAVAKAAATTGAEVTVTQVR